MIIEGKIWASGVYTLERILHYCSEKKIVDTKTIKITGNLVEEIGEQDDGENARKIIFRSNKKTNKTNKKTNNKSTVLIWKYNSKLGALYEKKPEEPQISI
jgi:ribonuclease HIII